MSRGKIAAVRLSADEKERLRALAASYGLKESALLKRAVDRLIDPGGLSGEGFTEPPPDGARLAKMLICLHPDIRSHVAQRARARGLPPATYVAAVIRSNVLNLRPLPKAEIRAFEQGRQAAGIARVRITAKAELPDGTNDGIRIFGFDGDRFTGLDAEARLAEFVNAKQREYNVGTVEIYGADRQRRAV